ncbi:hypothetical protein DWQ65_01910 [Treponema phagedenis]|uniref:Uncharacterized protein n=1 Tax=Treponema phagedenis TaxID=162 RepID=A0A0B7H1J6_TREPH|nr:hypothetical protein [Treponema phagedenis]QEK07134.1 hypothetical protein FUT80_10665 [Treponema phagedenis]QSH95601.1 hypothetical protein C5O78_11370 [Treponema phagedenis]QSH98849.1 hypothetical protein DWQ65_01910 [Treponema phagedenis]CEM62836.1 conserved exported hypothetical protein [Treponema phagedenis]
MTIFLSLVSGLVGAMVGAGIQIFYNNKIEKQRLLHDYKKICFAEWLHLNEELLILLREPQKENNTVFRQAIKQKTELLSFIAAVSKKHEKAVSKLKNIS